MAEETPSTTSRSFGRFPSLALSWLPGRMPGPLRPRSSPTRISPRHRLRTGVGTRRAIRPKRTTPLSGLQAPPRRCGSRSTRSSTRRISGPSSAPQPSLASTASSSAPATGTGDPHPARCPARDPWPSPIPSPLPGPLPMARSPTQPVARPVTYGPLPHPARCTARYPLPSPIPSPSASNPARHPCA